ncbi:hypothetical protein FSP39_001456 [Pinctada imbricata]|uniref:Mab-21-like HhH/H2TH-like domain-containing protein n=1 Tax=Pinctada imbricata TaxID=66713 RepID=A0AA88XE87_PINIB|nr:hypothetical protein FSP39_001456 [Pinctada imbricata]
MKGYSEAVYGILCNHLGNEEKVALIGLNGELVSKKFETIRVSPTRHFDKFQNMPHEKQFSGLFYSLMPMVKAKSEETSSHVEKEKFYFSGSRAEGFELPTSDYDFMVEASFGKAIQCPNRDIFSLGPGELLVVEKSRTMPGFVRLRLPFDPVMFRNIFTPRDGEYYLSSLMFKLLLQTCTDNFTLHGPCIGPAEGDVDVALVIPSDTWPHEALGCVTRLVKRKWPSDLVIREMIQDGCLLVPIGCKSSPNEDIEWRMSFSLAEKRLVHSMNHTQFLTYALLKFFLKDVIERHSSVKDLLCSYFMKTLVFWEIMETSIPWRPEYLLLHFWNCFRKLLVWVNKEYCPNFFVPENNMFRGKIFGQNRKTLLRVLSCLYRDGYLVLNSIPLIQKELHRWRRNPTQSISRGIRRSDIIQKLLFTSTFPIWFPFEITSAESMEVLESSKDDTISEFCCFIRLCMFNISYFRYLCNSVGNSRPNKERYLQEKSLFYRIRVTSPDCIRYKIFFALFLYRCKRYEMCIRLLHTVITKLQDIETMYTWEFNGEKYTLLGGEELSVLNGLYKFTTSLVPLDSITCVPEILDECNLPHPYTKFHLVPPFVLTHFLFALSHFWTGDIQQSHIHLDDLRECLRRRNQSHITDDTEAISWEILGICEEILGNFSQALQSFEKCKHKIAPNDFTYDNLSRANKQRRNRIESFLRNKQHALH